MIERDLDPNGSGTYTTVVHYVWDGDNVVLAFNGSQQLIARYLNGPNTDAYDQYFTTLAEEDVTSLSSAGTVTFDLLDPQGSVVDIANSNGGEADHIVYGPFGVVAYESTPSILHLLSWQGGLLDSTTGLENFHERWQYLADGFWASQDPLGFLAGDTNLSRYVGNSPTNATDRSGLADQRRLSSDEQEEQIARMSEELDALVVAEKITSCERDLRIEIAKAAMSHRMGFSATAEPDPKYFYKDMDSDGDEVFRIRPGKAIEGIHSRVYRLGENNVGSDTGCTRAAQLLILEGLARLAVSQDKEEEFERRARDKTIDDFFPRGSNSIQNFESDYDDGIDPDTLIPGDRVWMQNHRFDPQHDEQGFEGSNVIYIGKDADGEQLFVHMDTPYVENYEQLQKTVRAYSQLNRDAQENYCFRQRYSPKVPPFLTPPVPSENQ